MADNGYAKAVLVSTDWIAEHLDDPNVVVANSLHGYIYTSIDAGETWHKNRREFGEIRALAWAPN